MIIDTLDTLGCYAGLGKNFVTAVRYLRTADLQHLTDGKIAIDGDRVFGTVRTTELTTLPVLWEAHRAYADIQLLLQGNEQIGYFARQKLSDMPPYSEESDCILAENLNGQLVELAFGQFMLLLPQDFHCPNIPSPQGSYSKKLIIKVLLDS